jgi:hypothetical protein
MADLSEIRLNVPYYPHEPEAQHEMMRTLNETEANIVLEVSYIGDQLRNMSRGICALAAFAFMIGGFFIAHTVIEWKKYN